MPKVTLHQIATFVKAEAPLIILGFLAISAVAVALFLHDPNQSSPPTPPGTPWQNAVYAGATSRQELEAKLGQPQKVEQYDNRLVYQYPSQNQFLPHTVEITQDTVTIIKEQVIGNEKGVLSDYQAKYGPAETKLFGSHGTIAPGHFWGAAGLLIFANQFDGTIVEIWYFQPTTLEIFQSQNPQLKTKEPRRF